MATLRREGTETLAGSPGRSLAEALEPVAIPERARIRAELRIASMMIYLKIQSESSFLFREMLGDQSGTQR
jgi:hypothetical protein